MAKGDNQKRCIVIYADWEGFMEPVLMGYLYAELLRGKELFSFEYDEKWLQSEHKLLIDPELQFYPGLHYVNDDKRYNFGIFLDSSPDRWGRILMRRREAALARMEKRTQRTLFETDYLLGVHDQHRMGALRFKSDIGGPFLNDNAEMASPLWTSIRELEQISLRLEDEDVIDDPEYLHWLSMLIAPGSSLGGARPKASVVDEDGHLWIAKFPSKNDTEDVGAWEIVTYELAIMSGVKMATAMAKKFSTQKHTFLTKRFDRTEHGGRIHFASAMTMLGRTDGEDYTDGVSYLDLVEFLIKQGCHVQEDLEQLWRRIVFSICVSNTDDHLRNHGFILTPKGWKLSPAYDINPVATGNGLKLNISEDDNALDLDLALSVCTYFRIDSNRAIEIIEEVKSAVRNWPKIAKKYAISKSEQELMARAFSRVDG